VTEIAKLRCLMLAFALAISLAGIGAAIAADTPLPDPALETRARALMKEVRCVVCQAQSIDESDAGIAVDLRRLIREEIAAGKSDDDIRAFLVARYGDFILFKPPFKAETLVLWLGPFAVLGGGLGFVIWFLRRRPSAVAPADLDQEERQRVKQALSQDSGAES
jgi:cytochrome c-type biogenesis protein CcmH